MTDFVPEDIVEVDFKGILCIFVEEFLELVFHGGGTHHQLEVRGFLGNIQDALQLLLALLIDFVDLVNRDESAVVQLETLVAVAI